MANPYHSILLSSRGNELLRHTKTWMNLKDTLLGERNQSQQDTDCMIPFGWQAPKHKAMAMKILQWFSRVLGGGGMTTRGWHSGVSGVPELFYIPIT